jgi:uncharacterized protein
MSFGKTGMIKPIARTSSVTVTRMKVIAAWRDFILKIGNCRGGRVGRKIEMTQATRLPLQIRVNLSLTQMIALSYRSLKTQVRESKIHGRGLFATTDIAKNEIVAVKGGHIISREELREITPRLGPVEIQIDDHLFIAPVTEEERESSMLYSNHSCDANIGIRGEITFVAMRDIRAGEELTHDWAMTDDDDDYAVECKCGAPNCRGRLTGKDWQRPELQKRYAGYFSAYLARRIAMLASGP